MLPPLRAREGDVALLARHFMREFSRKFQKGFTELTPEATQLLELVGIELTLAHQCRQEIVSPADGGQRRHFRAEQLRVAQRHAPEGQLLRRLLQEDFSRVVTEADRKTQPSDLLDRAERRPRRHGIGHRGFDVVRLLQQGFVSRQKD